MELVGCLVGLLWGEIWEGDRKGRRDEKRTLLLCLILLLVLREEHIVGERATGYRTLETHAVGLARQAPCASAAVGQYDTALLLDVDGALWLCALWLGLVLFLLLGAGPAVAVLELALLSLFRALAVDDGALDGLACVLARVVVFAFFLAERGVFGFLGFLFLLELLLFLVEALADVGGGCGAEDGAAAVLALDDVDLVFDGVAVCEAGEGLLVLGVDDRGDAAGGRVIFVAGVAFLPVPRYCRLRR